MKIKDLKIKIRKPLSSDKAEQYIQMKKITKERELSKEFYHYGSYIRVA